MIRNVTRCNVSCNTISVDAVKQRVSIGCLTEILRVARMLHCAMTRKCVAALRQSLRKVEPDSTSCNVSCNKSVA